MKEGGAEGEVRRRKELRAEKESTRQRQSRRHLWRERKEVKVW